VRTRKARNQYANRADGRGLGSVQVFENDHERPRPRQRDQCFRERIEQSQLFTLGLQPRYRRNIVAKRAQLRHQLRQSGQQRRCDRDGRN